MPFCFGRNETPQLFTVLPERRTGPVGAAMMASTHIYDMSTVRCPQSINEERKGIPLLTFFPIYGYRPWLVEKQAEGRSRMA